MVGALRSRPTLTKDALVSVLPLMGKGRKASKKPIGVNAARPIENATTNLPATTETSLLSADPEVCEGKTCILAQSWSVPIKREGV